MGIITEQTVCKFYQQRYQQTINDVNVSCSKKVDIHAPKKHENLPSRQRVNMLTLSNDAASGSEITPCNKIDKPLVVYRCMGNVMTSKTTLRTK